MIEVHFQMQEQLDNDGPICLIFFLYNGREF